MSYVFSLLKLNDRKTFCLIASVELLLTKKLLPNNPGNSKQQLSQERLRKFRESSYVPDFKSSFLDLLTKTFFILQIFID